MLCGKGSARRYTHDREPHTSPPGPTLDIQALSSMVAPSMSARCTIGLLTLGLVGLLSTAPASATGGSSDPLSWLASYLEIDTSNPPGNESVAVDFLARLLSERGIGARRFVSETGRVSLLARDEAPQASAPPLVLLHHIDVVPADERWTFDPFGATIWDGRMFGRGAIDSKSLGIAHLMAFLDAHSRRDDLRRDLWFLATADEETGGTEGLGWIMTRYPDLFDGVGAVLTEAGINRSIENDIVWWGIEVAQKRPLWLRLTTEGRGGHGSTYHPNSPTHTLVLALERMLAIDRRPHLSAPAFAFFRSQLPYFGSAYDALFDQPDLESARRALDRAVAENRLHAALPPGMTNQLRDTVQITGLDSGSTSVNVISRQATATVDIRLLPDTDDQAFLEEIREALGPTISVEVLLEAPRVEPMDPDEPTFASLRSHLERSAPVMPVFIAGTTDARYFRERGIPAYGFSPFLLTSVDSIGIHDADESIPTAVFEDGVERMIEVVRDLAGSPRGR